MKIDYLENKNGQRIELNKFTVLVGPNNAGKSRTLRDIHEHFIRGKIAKPVIMKNVGTPKPKSVEEVLNNLRLTDHPNSVGMKQITGIDSKLIKQEKLNFNPDQIKREYDESEDSSFIFGNIAKFKISYLDADSRLNVAARTNSYNPYDEVPQNLLQALFESEETEIDLKKAFKSSFQMDLHLDSAGNQICLRVAKEFETIPENPRKAVRVLRKYQILDDQGDGYKSFIGVVLSLLLSKDRIILLDEPEAFLHPAQARQLGFWIAEHSSDIDGQIIIATHNANFLAGILSSNQNVDIFRLNRKKENETEFHLMPPLATESLAKSPLLSSQRILDSIFHKGVIVCEADADRAVYQAVATKCFDNNQFVFIHAHNKQTIPKVVELLTEASIPVCVISDLDLINDPALIKLVELLGADKEIIDIIKGHQKKLIKEILNAESIELLKNLEEEILLFLDQLKKGKHTLAGARGALGRLKKDASDWKIIKMHGVDAFSDDNKEIVKNLIQVIKSIGLFVTPVGELEGWMDLGTTQKNKWIVKALEEIHEGNTSKKLQNFVSEVLQFFDKELTNPSTPKPGLKNMPVQTHKRTPPER